MTVHRQVPAESANHTGGFLWGLLVGGLIGSVVALLLAPQSGKKTRDGLEEESIELRDQVIETVEGAFAKARGKAKEVARSVRKGSKELAEHGQSILDDQVDILSEVIEVNKRPWTSSPTAEIDPA